MTLSSECGGATFAFLLEQMSSTLPEYTGLCRYRANCHPWHFVLFASCGTIRILLLASFTFTHFLLRRQHPQRPLSHWTLIMLKITRHSARFKSRAVAFFSTEIPFISCLYFFFLRFFWKSYKILRLSSLYLANANFTFLCRASQESVRLRWCKPYQSTSKKKKTCTLFRAHVSLFLLSFSFSYRAPWCFGGLSPSQHSTIYYYFSLNSQIFQGKSTPFILGIYSLYF